MSEVASIVPIQNVGSYELSECADEINYLVSRQDTQDMLITRHLPGVRVRHGGSPVDSLANLKRAQRANPKELSASIIYSTDQFRAIGLASAKPNLELWQQKVKWRPGVFKFGNMMLRKQLEAPGPNVSAWVRTDVDCYEALLEAYLYLGIHNRSAWTIEPIRSGEDVHTAIADAGYTAIVRGYFDDEESKKIPLPFSALYVSKP